jgi:periplasmic protein TonB
MLEQLERHEVEEQRLEPRLVTPPVYPVENDQRQRRRMVIALILLLVALGLVLVKDRDFWFPSGEVAESDSVDEQAPVATLESASPTASPAAVAPKPSVPVRKKRHALIQSKTPQTPAPAPVVTASRAVLPPLRVEVEGGGQRQPIRPGSPSVKVEMQPGIVVPSLSEPARPATEVASADTAPLTNAGDRVQMSTDTRQALSRPVRPEYPLLARQMKVQGAVALQAQIGKDGGIQNLQVLAGPSILADAARAAVKQWRFKPHYQEGQPVETQANITVNFTIRTD